MANMTSTSVKHDLKSPARSVWVVGQRPSSIWRSVVHDLGHHGDLLSVGFLLLLAIAFAAFVVRPVFSFMRGDWPTSFFPVYSYLGQRLRDFDIPGWNPYQFAGMPFAGDPESGWMYLPAMFIYTLFPPEAATVAYIGFHVALAGVATYALARLLDLNKLGSLVAGASYALAWVAPATMQLVIFFPAAIWLIIALIGIELAIRADSWPRRIGCWLFAGLAISQIIAIWLGQSSYYAFLTVGAWMVFRTLLFPPESLSAKRRLTNLAMTGIGVLGAALGLSAASILPRFEMVSLSNLAGGVYNVTSAWEDAQTGFSPPELLYELIGGFTGSLWWYVGAVAATLSIIAPIVAFRWGPLWFFVGLASISSILALDNRTPVHDLLYAILPRFGALHEHAPERVLILVGPAVALLAGATISYLPLWRNSRLLLLVTTLLPAMLTLVALRVFVGTGDPISQEASILIIGASALVACFALATSKPVRQLALAGLLLLVIWDPAGRMLMLGFVDESRLERSLASSLDVSPETFLYQNGAAAFIAAQSAAAPARYAGFNPTLLPSPATINFVPPEIGYRGWGSMKDAAVQWLLVFNWGSWFGIEDMQGYNPIQNRRYVEYVDALNGHRQEYHERDLFPAGLKSPLLDLLNLRFLVVPAAQSGLLESMPSRFSVAYADSRVQVLENADAFPRAWLVHKAQTVAPGEALPLLADGSVNPREVAVLETSPPPLDQPPDPSTESVAISHYEADRIDLNVSASAPALLMLSEVWDPGWVASVSGNPAPILIADHALRAIPVPEGRHTVVLRYDPPSLRLGLAITILTAAAMMAAAIVIGWRKSRRNGRSA